MKEFFEGEHIIAASYLGLVLLGHPFGGACLECSGYKVSFWLPVEAVRHNERIPKFLHPFRGLGLGNHYRARNMANLHSDLLPTLL